VRRDRTGRTGSTRSTGRIRSILRRAMDGGLAAALAGAMVACGSPSPAAHASPARLTIFAASSLRDPLAQVATAYRARTGVGLEVSTGASSALLTQLEQGARADVFLAADTATPTALVTTGLADGPIVPFAGNSLVIAVPSGNPAGIRTAADLARPGLRLIAAGAEVPISHYVDAELVLLARASGMPLDLAARYAANVVSREESARAVLTKIELGEGDAAIVYRTDAEHSTSVEVISIPAEAAVPITYAGVVPLGAPSPAAGHAFLAWLVGPQGAGILGAFGFSPPPSSSP